MRMIDGSCSHHVSVGANEHLIGSLDESNVTQKGWSDKAQAPVKSTGQQNNLAGTRPPQKSAARMYVGEHMVPDTQTVSSEV